MLDRRVAVTLASIILDVILLLSNATIVLTGQYSSLMNLQVNVGNGYKEPAKPSQLLFFTPKYWINKFTWISTSNTIKDNFDDNDMSGWLYRLHLYNASDGTANAYTSNVAKYAGSYGVYVEVNLKSGVDFNVLDGAVDVYYPCSITGVNMVTLDAYVAPLKLGYDLTQITLYIIINRGGETFTLYGNSLSNQGWGELTSTWTINPTDKIIEVGFRIYWKKNYPSDNTWIFSYIYIDEVTIQVDQPIFEGTTVTMFQVTCDYTITGRHVKSSLNNPENTCNYTIRIYHAVDSQNNWQLAYQYPVTNASIPYSAVNWQSGWLTLMAASTEGSHTYYIKVELEVKAYDLSNNIITKTDYAVLSLSMKWQNTWMPGKTYTVKLIESSFNPSITVSIPILGLAVLIVAVGIVAAAICREE